MKELKTTCVMCGRPITVWVPRGLSRAGLLAISVCEVCDGSGETVKEGGGKDGD